MDKSVRNLLVALSCLLGLGGMAAFAALRQARRPVQSIVVNVANEFDKDIHHLSKLSTFTM